jgi:Effector Associated Constant Component 1
MVTVNEQGADAERLAQLASTLRTELLALDVERVEHGRGATAPRGARGIDAVDAGVLLTSLTASAETVGHLVGAIQGWLRRDRSAVPRTVELTIGDSKVTVTGAAREQQDTLIAAFLSSVTRP